MSEVKKVIPIGPEALPPPGAARKEELAKRKDALEEEAEKRGEDMGVIDPSKLEKDEAVLHELHKSGGPDTFEVTQARSGYHYRWVSFRKSGLYVKAAKYHGWELVSGNMPEAIEHLHVSGARVIADDVVLMRIPNKQWVELQEKKRVDNLRKQGLFVSEGLGQYGRVMELGKDPVLNQLLSREPVSVTIRQRV